MELLGELLQDLGFVYSVGPAQVAGKALARTEGEHVVVRGIVFGRAPQRAEEGEAELFATTAPVGVDQGSQLLAKGLLHQLPELALDKGHHPTLASGEHSVSACPGLQLPQSPYQELFLHCSSVPLAQSSQELPVDF